MTYEFSEEQRQAIVLAIARLAVERPGWNFMLSEIADELKPSEVEPLHDRFGTPIELPDTKRSGRDLFESFKVLSAR